METIKLNSHIVATKQLKGLDLDAIRHEQMVFGASLSFIRAHHHKLPLTSVVAPMAAELLGARDSAHVIVDTRVHMLMPGWYPCIPGWHHDDVARTRADGQPNYREQPYLADHVLLVLNSHLAPTEFALGQHELPLVPEGQPVYRTWHPLVEHQIEQGILRRVPVSESTLTRFSWQTMHRGVESTSRGWRYFFRATIRCPRFREEFRQQTQIYIAEDANRGW